MTKIDVGMRSDFETNNFRKQFEMSQFMLIDPSDGQEKIGVIPDVFGFPCISRKINATLQIGRFGEVFMRLVLVVAMSLVGDCDLVGD